MIQVLLFLIAVGQPLESLLRHNSICVVKHFKTIYLEIFFRCCIRHCKSKINRFSDQKLRKQYKELHEELKLLPFATTEGPRGSVLIELEYLKTTWRFTPVEILAMLFTHLKNITQKDLESPVVDCVIGIPSYFTDSQRREYLDAAYIAGLKPLRLLHDGTAIALGYGMYKTEFCNTGPTVVTFVDIGHCDTQVTVAAFEQGGMKILAHAFDRNLGGRDFDEVLFKHFAALFSEKYKIDVCGDTRACVRLRAACEKVKRVLSPFPVESRLVHTGNTQIFLPVA
ncbi:putative Heat shock protein 70 family [Helianthus debilis subsp. tardiflorus]